MIKGKLAKSKPVNPFYSCYPSGGSFSIYEAIEKNLEGKSTICLEKEPARISHNGDRITEVTLKTGERQCPDHVVSTIPMNELIGLMDPAPPEAVITAMKKLRYRSEVYLFLTIDKPYVSDMSHMYFLDDTIPFTRVSEMKHFSKTMSPPDKTSLFFEFFCREGDNIWNMSKEELYEKTIRHLEKYGLLKREEVIDVVCLREKGIYPVFDLSYRDNLAIVTKYLHGFSNLIYAGRMATFQYSGHDDVLKMGVLSARTIIDNKKYNIENPLDEEAVFNS